MLAVVTGAYEHVRRNRAAWDLWAAEYAGAGARNWAVTEPTWGIWTITHPLATLEWAQRWRCEEVWKARKLRRPAGGPVSLSG